MLPMPFPGPTTYPGHSGVDFPQDRGTPIRASGPGRVGLRRTTPNGGNMVWIDYDGPGVGVGYAHMDSWDRVPPVGARVSEGDVIGLVGSSGRATGPHLHIEIADRPGEASVWQVFDRTRVVGQAPAGGGMIAPPFPLPDGWYFGPQDGPEWSVSGFHGHRDDLRVWQQRMRDRGWDITVDGLYGDQTARITRAFQAEKGLTVDGLIGPQTWRAAWELPVT